MAQQQCNFGFREVHLEKSEELGRGSYGAVYEAECDQLVCAAKVLHPILFTGSDSAAHGIVERFQREINFLSGLRHPNIIQYLGSCEDPDTRMPVLFMELMDESLTKFLERPADPPPLPFHIQVDIAHDVAQALSHLHRHEVLHRDLTSNNVLLIGNRRAKVTDFGMARLFSDLPLTRCPGAHVYMSPEALVEPPTYTSKLDIFSCGVLFVQLITRKFPNPSARTYTVNDSRFASGRVLVEVPELQRRKEHLDLISPTHHLLDVALHCIKDKESQRPTAEQLCSRLIPLKQSAAYRDSLQQTVGMACQTSTRDRELEQLLRESESKIEDLTRQVQHLNQQSEANSACSQQRDQQLQLEAQANRELLQQLETSKRENEQVLASLQKNMEEGDAVLHEREELLRELQQLRIQTEENIQEKDRKNQELQLQIQVTREENQQLQLQIEARQEENQQLKQQIQADLEKNQQLQLQIQANREEVCQHIETKNEQVASLQQSMEEKDAALQQAKEDFLRDFQELQQKMEEHLRTIKCKIQQREQKPQQESLSKVEDNPQMASEGDVDTRTQEKEGALVWSDVQPAPYETFGCCFAVSGDFGYCRDGFTKKRVLIFDSRKGVWTVTPEIVKIFSSLAILKGQLTAIGGEDGCEITNTLQTISYDQQQHMWIEQYIFPPMKHCRNNPAVTTTDTLLIVAGGRLGTQTLSEVEVMNIKTQVWTQVVNLPYHLYQATATVCGERLYLGGGYSGGVANKLMVMCNIKDLVQSQAVTSSNPPVWKEETSLPVAQSSLVTFQGQLLSVGGGDSSNTTSEVRQFDATTNSWTVISNMKEKRSCALVGVFPNNKLIVCGGYNESHKPTRSTELAFLNPLAFSS